MPNCSICGEPMPEGEEMFKFHGYSGPCPKPPLPAKPAPKIDAVIEYVYRDAEGEFWLDIVVDRLPWAQLGPYASADERHGIKADLLNMMRTMGAKDLPLRTQ